MRLIAWIEERVKEQEMLEHYARKRVKRAKDERRGRVEEEA